MAGSGDSRSAIKVLPILECQEYLDAVKWLGIQNQKTLGLFPEGAFDEYAAKGTILVAADTHGQCAGYLLYRRTRGRAIIVHLCVGADMRGRGVARTLVSALLNCTGDLLGAGLKCRRDYPANDLWPKFGFTVQEEIPGRGKDGHTLVAWWRANPHPTLFGDILAKAREAILHVPIDANILFDLLEPAGRDSVASVALTADWLEGSLQLCVTEELFTEINRHTDEERRKVSFRFARRFPCLTCSSIRYDAVHSELRPLFPAAIGSNTESDIRQVARAIAAEATYFVTRDADLLRHRDDVQEQFGLIIVHPTELISRFDEFRRAAEYEPVRFAGTALSLRLISGTELDSIAAAFQDSDQGEKKTSLLKQLHEFAAQPERFRCSVLGDGSDKPLSLVVTDEVENSHELVVRVLRVRPVSTASTVARQMIRHVLLLAAQRHIPVVSMTDVHCGMPVEEAAARLGFFQCGKLQKLNIYGVHTGPEIAGIIRGLGTTIDLAQPIYQDLLALLDDPAGIGKPETLAMHEHLLWPGKISDGVIPNYVVPIQPRWAQELFDTHLAAQTLYPRNIELGLNIEAVYYRTTQGPTITAPARLLWYVSESPQYDGAKAVRACSTLIEALVTKPKEAFRRFRRLGVYQWSDVIATANDDHDQEIMALRFTDTILFDAPIGYQALRRELEMAGCNHTMVGPVLIPPPLFLKLYTQGVR